ncbi:hypothetical protein KY339_02430 [Candidatus Woesearchaeota archaeon]|nr:hypothetical protein [Candidatus Woesearchaeota archaeon]
MRQKKAAIEVQFHWIFVFIVGAIIFLFFFTVITKQKAASETKLADTVLSDLEGIMIASSVATGKEDRIDIPKVDFEVNCDELLMAGIIKSLGNQIVFSPSRIMGTELVIWTLDWNVPFKVTNFMYMTSPLIKYYFVYDDASKDFASEVFKKMPKVLTEEKAVELVEYKGPAAPLEIEYEGNYKVKFVVFFQMGPQTTITLDPDFEDVDYSIVHLTTPEEDFEQGNLMFYNKVPGGIEMEGEYDYVGMPSLYGAIFVDNFEHYQCAMEKAMNKLGLVARVYAGRSTILSYEVTEFCKNFQFTAISDFNALTEDEPDIRGIVRTLKQTNQNAIRNSCPVIY